MAAVDERPYRRLGLAMVVSSAILGVAGISLAFVSSGPGPNGLDVYPYLSGRAASIVASLFVFSGFLFGFASVLLWRRWKLIEVGPGVGLLLVGVGLFIYTISIAKSVQYPGFVITTIPYPQTIYPVIWGLSVLVVFPMNWYMNRKMAPARLRNAQRT
jgi:hypothetical protein